MTNARPLLSVRLDSTLAEALDDYCTESGATRSQVVQEGLAQYLVSRVGPTLSSLAEALLPPLRAAKTAPKPQNSRQKRFRDYVREKRRR
jgi:Ribbon-helix-helix protein, copG family.